MRKPSHSAHRTFGSFSLAELRGKHHDLEREVAASQTELAELESQEQELRTELNAAADAAKKQRLRVAYDRARRGINDLCRRQERNAARARLYQQLVSVKGEVGSMDPVAEEILAGMKIEDVEVLVAECAGDAETADVARLVERIHKLPRTAPPPKPIAAGPNAVLVGAIVVLVVGVVALAIWFRGTGDAPLIDSAVSAPRTGPLLTVSSPQQAEAVLLADEPLIVRFFAQPGAQGLPVTSIEARINGDLARQQIPLKTDDFAYEWELPMPPGVNDVVLTAYDDASHSQQQFRVVVRSGEGGRLLILAIGVDDYPQPLGDLKHAAKDAVQLVEVLASQGAGVPAGSEFTDDARSLVNGSADRTGIKEGLAWLRRRMTEDDTAIVLFSGHGQRQDDELYLIPGGLETDTVMGNALSFSEFGGSLAKTQGRILVCLDCCHSGAAINFQDRRERKKPHEGILILCATGADDAARESSALGHGILTAGVISGLRGAADDNQDSVIESEELAEFARKYVDDHAQHGQQLVRVGGLPSFTITHLADDRR